eukprot:TRINITY_DN9969_c0_g1_i4.p1 TRINITY_DN9969_c0_g1~~TRINITY_DN9969_c0_g1_i4.p1  ORF type:complete len:118 (-),score=12.62 TRINITY_DN9969_c0_g1_i4:31-384(-)
MIKSALTPNQLHVSDAAPRTSTMHTLTGLHTGLLQDAICLSELITEDDKIREGWISPLAVLSDAHRGTSEHDTSALVKRYTCSSGLWSPSSACTQDVFSCSSSSRKNHVNGNLLSGN